MEQVTVTAKIQISVNTDNKVVLDKTMSVYSDACNYVSAYVFRTHDLKQFSLNKALYSTLREKFGLKSQMAQSVFKTVIARYRTILENHKEWIKPNFKRPQYDLVWNRDYSLTQSCFSVNTLNGRVKLPYFTKGMSKYFDHTIYKFGTAKLVNKHGKYFLHIPVTYDVEEASLSKDYILLDIFSHYAVLFCGENLYHLERQQWHLLQSLSGILLLTWIQSQVFQ